MKRDNSISREKVPCPYCGKAFWFEQKTSLRIPGDEKYKEQILSSEYYQPFCPKCGQQLKFSVSCTYMDSEKKLMILSEPEPMKGQDEQILARLRMDHVDASDSPLENVGSWYLRSFCRRVVYNGDSLREKIYLWDLGYDDRIIELLKLSLSQAYIKEHGGTVNRMFLDEREGERLTFILMLGERAPYEMVSLDAPASAYDLFREQLSSRLGPPNRDEYLITDRDWAIASGLLNEKLRDGFFGAMDEAEFESFIDPDAPGTAGEAGPGWQTCATLSFDALQEKLYEAAFRFKKTKLWEYLWSSDIFAFRHGDGTIGYVSVMGRGGDLTAVALFDGDEGARSLDGISHEQYFEYPWEQHEHQCSQLCLSCCFEAMDDLRPEEQESLRGYCRRHDIKLRGKNACPHFEVYTPGYLPWSLTERIQEAHLLEAVELCTLLGEELRRLEKEDPDEFWSFLQIPGEHTGPKGRQVVCFEVGEDGMIQMSMIDFPKYRPEYPAAQTDGQVEALKNLKKKKKSGKWGACILLGPARIEEPRPDAPTDAPWFPVILLLVTLSGPSVVTAKISSMRDYPAELAGELVAYMEEMGVPSGIVAVNRRTERFLSGITRMLGIRLTLDESELTVTEAATDFFNQQMRITDPDWDDDDWDDFPDGPDGCRSGGGIPMDPQTLAMLGDPVYLRRLSPEMVLAMDELLRLCGTEDMPEEIVKNIRAEAARRRKLF